MEVKYLALTSFKTHKALAASLGDEGHLGVVDLQVGPDEYVRGTIVPILIIPDTHGVDMIGHFICKRDMDAAINDNIRRKTPDL
jgi:hypothetical protein